VAFLAGADARSELAFTRAQIDANFSNYSAWHHRASLLRLAEAGGGGAEAGRWSAPLFAPAPPEAAPRLGFDALRAEFELVSQAFYTEPEDQAGWFYHGWLEAEALAAAGEGAAISWAQAAELLSAQADVCRSLAAEEPECRWPLLTLVRLLRALAAVRAACPGQPAGEGWEEEAAAAVRRLAEVDPLRRGMYADWQTELVGG
jgi:geranylgeranyl transferase type-2 subunit alpha